MTEPRDRLAQERAEIAARVARVRAAQKKFQRERQQYCRTTLENAINGAKLSLWP
jgi:chorismate mutase